MSTAIRNIRFEETDEGTCWYWTVIGDEFYRRGSRYRYHTDDKGEGIFCYDHKRGEDRQITGTGQFSACETVSGMRRKLDRWFESYWPLP